MIDYLRLIEAMRSRMGSRAYEASGVGLFHCLDAAAAELRRQRDAALHECPADCGVTANCATCDMAADATTVCDVLRRELDRVQRQRDAARAELDKLKQVQGACRERIFALLADDDLSDDKLRQFAEGGLPENRRAKEKADGK